MARKLQSIYEYFNEYSEEEINKAIYNLSIEDKLILWCRYGDDLHNPITMKAWSKDKSVQFYNNVIPKIKDLLKNKKRKKESINDQNIIRNIKNLELFIRLIEGKTNSEICEKLKLTNNQFCNCLLNLKNNGTKFIKNYYYDGTIKYNTPKSFSEINKYYAKTVRTIITPENIECLKLLAISDLHFGNGLERLDLVDRAFEYCIKNGINIILCGGDFIDGCYSGEIQKITDVYKQIDYFIKKYPFDKNIITFGVGGDHDLSVLQNKSINLIDICESYRHDIVIGGFNNATLNINADKIHLYHKCPGGELQYTKAPIIFNGHSHKFIVSRSNKKNEALQISIPALSNIGQLMPGALEVNLAFNKNYITNTLIKHIYFGSQDIVLSETYIEIPKKNIEDNIQENNTEKVKTK